MSAFGAPNGLEEPHHLGEFGNEAHIGQYRTQVSGPATGIFQEEQE
jgi:hypothetical protein